MRRTVAEGRGSLIADPRVVHIVGAIVTMGNAMLKRVVAEGVETAADIEALAVLGDVDLQLQPATAIAANTTMSRSRAWP